MSPERGRSANRSHGRRSRGGAPLLAQPPHRSLVAPAESVGACSEIERRPARDRFAIVRTPRTGRFPDLDGRDGELSCHELPRRKMRLCRDLRSYPSGCLSGAPRTRTWNRRFWRPMTPVSMRPVSFLEPGLAVGASCGHQPGGERDALRRRLAGPCTRDHVMRRRVRLYPRTSGLGPLG